MYNVLEIIEIYYNYAIVKFCGFFFVNYYWDRLY